MSFRARILLGLLAVAVIPLAVLGVAVRSRVGDAIASQYEERVTALVTVIRHDIDRQDRSIAERLDAVTAALAGDDRFRQGLRQGPMDDPYVLDYAERAMRQSGLDLLQVQNAEGRILSSGHFRNEYDLLEPALPTLLARVPGGLALVSGRRPEATFLALARVDSVRVGSRMLSVVGGIEVDRQFLDGLGSGDAIAVTPNLQWVINPSLNEDVGSMTYFQIRARLAICREWAYRARRSDSPGRRARFGRASRPRPAHPDTRTGGIP